ncbi:MAG: hypothetical protein LBD37_10990, partial [Treponema sp.]|nr:hypothetical protein [Treponema sp.]
GVATRNTVSEIWQLKQGGARRFLEGRIRPLRRSAGIDKELRKMLQNVKAFFREIREINT